MLQWIEEQAGVEAIGAVDAGGGTPTMTAAQRGQLDVVKWIASQLGPDCLRAADNGEGTSIFWACSSGQPAVAEYIFDVRGGEALQMLEYGQGTQRAQPDALAHLRRPLVIPDEQPTRLCAMKRLALAKAVHARLGANSPLAELSERELQKIGCLSGLRGERETCAQVLRVAAGLYERHKLTFAANPCFHALRKRGEIPGDKFMFLLRAPMQVGAEKPEVLDFLSLENWETLSLLEMQLDDSPTCAPTWRAAPSAGRSGPRTRAARQSRCPATGRR